MGNMDQDVYKRQGLLVPVGDAYALADAFRKILSDPQYAQKLSLIHILKSMYYPEKR